MELEKQAKQTVAEESTSTRRKFLLAAGGAAAAATLAACGKKEEAVKTEAPAVSVKPSTIIFKMQGAWGAKDVFNEMAEEYVKRVNEMAGGRLRIDYLVAGAVVKPFEVMEATSRG